MKKVSAYLFFVVRFLGRVLGKALLIVIFASAFFILMGLIHDACKHTTLKEWLLSISIAALMCSSVFLVSEFIVWLSDLMRKWEFEANSTLTKKKRKS